MNKKLILPSHVLALCMIAICSFATIAVACPDYQESGCGGGWSWFGLRYDGANIAQGQTVTLDCDAAIVSVEFLFRLSGTPNNDVPSMVAGDDISVSVFDTDYNVLATVTLLAPADVFEEWMEFQFPDDLIVPAGQYLIAAHTTAQGWGSMGFCYGEGSDTYEGGSRTGSVNGLEGPWAPFDEGDDIPFRLYLDESSVATEQVVWGSIKGMYR